jgi:hypothetical protein
VLLVVLACTLAACDGPGVVDPRHPVIAGVGTGGSVSASVTGAWRRTLFFVDEFGFAHSSETTWEFRQEGTAVRTVVARNHTLGIADVIVTVARWRTEGTQLRIEFVSPQPGQITLEFRLVGTQLFLAGETFDRLQ